MEINIVLILLETIISLFFFLGVIYLILYLAKITWEKSKKKNKKKEIELLNKILKSIKSIFFTIFLIVNIIFKVSIASLIGIALKPYIYQLNYPLGMGYATFASYVVAILIYTFIPNIIPIKYGR